MRKKDLYNLLLDEYFEIGQTYTKETVKNVYGIYTLPFFFWIWSLFGWGTQDEKNVTVESESDIINSLSKGQSYISIVKENRNELEYDKETIDIYLPPEKINKFNLFIISSEKTEIGLDATIKLIENGKTVCSIPARIIKGEILEIHKRYKYEISAGFDTKAKMRGAKWILTFLKINA